MKKTALFVATLALTTSISAKAEGDPATYCKQAAKLYQENDIPGAVEEAKWCLESLEQIQQSQKGDRFAKQVAGWQRGEVSKQKAMGMSMIETEYSKGNKYIKVSYNSGVSGMGAMFSQMGLAGGGKKIRLGRYTGLVLDEGRNNEILVNLKMTQGMVNLSSDTASMAELQAFAKAFPIKDIDQ
ncbi:MAG: hypothetical protein AB2551_02290 [Candidatus Thiodiazotropha sp.]|nr:hypothetical protein [Chromatiales bacterium]